jgi:hypothetical protein
MTDDLEPTEGAEPADEIEQAQEPAFDPEAFKASMKEELGTRIKGFQRLVSKKDEEIANLRAGLSDLSEDERDERLVASEQRIAELESALEAQRFQSQAPDEWADYQRLLQANGPEDVMAILREIKQPAEPEPETLVADVDPNNPMSASQEEPGVLMPSGLRMTESLSQSILNAASRRFPGRGR